jgi:hypothetical protein
MGQREGGREEENFSLMQIDRMAAGTADGWVARQHP